MSATPPEHEIPPELAATLQQLDDLIDGFELHPDEKVQQHAVLLLQCIDRLHRKGLQRIAELLQASGLEHPALNDPQVRLLFELYDLHPGGEQERAEAVLDTIRPTVQLYGGRLELIAARSGVIAARLSGAPPTLRDEIEQVLRDGLPDFARLELEVIDPQPRGSSGFVPLSSLTQSPP